MLKAKGRLIVQSTLNHSYPYCWRFVGLLLSGLNSVILTDISCAQVRYSAPLPRHPRLVRSRATDHRPTHAKQCRDTLVSYFQHYSPFYMGSCFLLFQGSHNTSKRDGSATGSLMLETGIFRGIASGGHPSRCGSRTITRRYAHKLLGASVSSECSSKRMIW